MLHWRFFFYFLLHDRVLSSQRMGRPQAAQAHVQTNGYTCFRVYGRLKRTRSMCFSISYKSFKTCIISKCVLLITITNSVSRVRVLLNSGAGRSRNMGANLRLRTTKDSHQSDSVWCINVCNIVSKKNPFAFSLGFVIQLFSTDPRLFTDAIPCFHTRTEELRLCRCTVQRQSRRVALDIPVLPSCTLCRLAGATSPRVELIIEMHK